MTSKIYENVTNRIIERIEAGNMSSWLKSWSAQGSGAPVNPVTGTEYSGINYLLLSLAGYDNQNWLTYKQAQKLGANVRKGEKSTMIIFYKKLNFKEQGENGAEIEKAIPMLRGYLVFNASQIDNLPAKYQLQAPARPRQVSNLFELAVNAGLKVEQGGSKAFYSPVHDMIKLPQIEAFIDNESFEATLLHEMTHLTGHKTRLDRFKKFDRFGSESYAFEELIAELGSAFACAKLGIESTGLQHAEYINSWLKVLKKDKQAIFKAATEAQKACNWLIEKLNTQTQSLIQQSA